MDRYHDDVQSRHAIYGDAQPRLDYNPYAEKQSKVDQYTSSIKDIYGCGQSRQNFSNTYNGDVKSRPNIPYTYNSDAQSPQNIPYTYDGDAQSRHNFYGDAQSRLEYNPYAEKPTKADHYRSAVKDIYRDAQLRQHQSYNTYRHHANKRGYQPISPHLADFFSNTVFAYAAQATVESAVHDSLSLKHVPLNVSNIDLSAFTRHLLSLVVVPSQSIFLALRYLSLYFANRDNLLTPQDLRLLLAVSLVLANKSIDDCTYRNSAWAQAIGIPLKELNRIERDMLSALDYSLSCSDVEYQQWLDSVSTYVLARAESIGVSSMADKSALSQIVHDRAGLGKAQEKWDLEQRLSLDHRESFVELEAFAMAMMERDLDESMAGPIPEEYLPVYDRLAVSPEYHDAEEYLPVRDRVSDHIAQEYQSESDSFFTGDGSIREQYLPSYDRVEDLDGPIPEKYLPVYNRVESCEVRGQETQHMSPAPRMSAWITSYLGRWLMEHSMHHQPSLFGRR